jgi:hypothetical protein
VEGGTGDPIGQQIRAVVKASEEALAASGPWGSRVLDRMRQQEADWEREQAEWLDDLQREVLQAREDATPEQP